MAITRVWIKKDFISCGNSEDNYLGIFELKNGIATVLENFDYSGLEE